MLRIVEAIIGLELCKQSCTKQAALCQGKIHASEAALCAAERARYQGKKLHPPMIYSEATYQIGSNSRKYWVKNLPLSLYYLEFHKDLYLGYYCFFCILMT